MIERPSKSVKVVLNPLNPLDDFISYPLTLSLSLSQSDMTVSTVQRTPMSLLPLYDSEKFLNNPLFR